mgnify:CR=1 FL=1
MPDLTPLDILGVGFPVRFRGYDAAEVRSFLQQLAGAMEELFRERGELRQKVHHLEQELTAFRDRESALRDALVAAQKSAEITVEAREQVRNEAWIRPRNPDELHDGLLQLGFLCEEEFHTGRSSTGTAAEAARSALAQRCDFAFNVITVDNLTGTATTESLAALAREDPRLIHLVPERRDLGIGGCWNTAIYSERCGRFAVQLDSDDDRSYEAKLRDALAAAGAAHPSPDIEAAADDAQARADRLDLPIVKAVAGLVEKRLDVTEAMSALLSRSLKEE